MSRRKIVVLGGGFAGLWSAIGAARKLSELGAGDVAVTLVNRLPFHDIRVRNYETDLTPTRLPLADVLDPVGVRLVVGEVAGVDVAARSVAVSTDEGPREFGYDRLVVALGSHVVYPPIEGLDGRAFDVDTHDHAVALNAHVASLAREPARPGLLTVVIVGAGLAGIEVATEMPVKLAAASKDSDCSEPARVVLLDRSPRVGSHMGAQARPVIEQALTELGVEWRTGVTVAAVDDVGVTLSTGEVIPAATVVMCTGLHASPITEQLPVARDRLGRLPVDNHLEVEGLDGVFAAGDVAALVVDDENVSMMSCQHSRPMGRFAGHNVVCDLLGLPMLPLRLDWYVTVLDLGAGGAVYTEGWDRRVAAKGDVAKRTKQVINTQRIYPPLTGDPADIFKAGAPEIDHPPAR